MRLPKKINIGGKDYTVKRDESWPEGRGRANIETRVITVGSKNRTPDIAFETFLHEIMEASLLENALSFHRNANPDDYFFMMSHAEFSRFADDVACSIRGMLK